LGKSDKPKQELSPQSIKTQVAYFECVRCKYAWVGTIGAGLVCSNCDANDPIGPIWIGRTRRKLELALIDTEGVQDAGPVKEVANLTEAYVRVSRIALRTASQIQALAEADLHAGNTSDQNLSRLGLAMAIYLELGMAESFAATGHLLGMAYIERGLKHSIVGSIADLDDLFSGLILFDFLNSKPFVAMSHLKIGFMSSCANPGNVQSVQGYASLMSLALFHLTEARHLYEELSERKDTERIDGILSRVSRQTESAIHGWSRESAASIGAEATVRQGQLLRDGLVEQGRLISNGIRDSAANMSDSIRISANSIGSGINNAGALIGFGLSNVGKEFRTGLETAGNKLGRSIGRLGLAAGLSLVGGSIIHGKLMKDGLTAIGPSIAGSIEHAGSKLAEAAAAVPKLLSGESSVRDLGNIINIDI
jgi:hypothetical protein